MVDLVEHTQTEIERRLAELRPIVEEHERLEAALAALDDLERTGAAPRRPAKRGRQRRRRKTLAPRRAGPKTDFLAGDPGGNPPLLAPDGGFVAGDPGGNQPPPGPEPAV